MQKGYSLPATGPASFREELANGITHGLGFALSLAGTGVLMLVAFQRGDAWQVAGCAIYSASLIAVYGASTLSHVVHEPARKRRFRILDQAFIYLLIAGTFTPIGLTYLREGWWLLLLVAMWAVALAGFASKMFWAHRIEGVSTVLYVLLGWMPVVGARPLLTLLPSGVIWWMVTGGLFYTLGTVFLSLDERVPYFHCIWHLMVIAGSVSHWLAILLYVIPA